MASTVTSLKSVCDRGQSWITNRIEKFASSANKLSTFNNGYSKIQPRILPKGLSTFKKEDSDDFDDENDNFLKNTRPRIHSIDVIDNRVRDSLREQNYYDDKTRETLLVQRSIELTVIDAIATPKRYNKSNKKDKIIVKSIDDDSDIKVLPSVLLTYNPKFTKISDSRRNSFGYTNSNSSDSNQSLNFST